jgi:hypothetical protein
MELEESYAKLKGKLNAEVTFPAGVSFNHCQNTGNFTISRHQDR